MSLTVECVIRIVLSCLCGYLIGVERTKRLKEAGVISGISFIGAGVIYKNGNSVKGLTTAAGMWATSVIGLAIGGGMYIMGATLTVLVVIIQVLFHRYSIGADVYAETDVTVEAEMTDAFREMLFSQANQKRLQIISMKIERNMDGQEVCTAVLRPKEQVSVQSVYDLFSRTTDIRSITSKF